MTHTPLSELRKQIRAGTIDADAALRQVESQLESGHTVGLLIARGDFIQLGDSVGYELDDARNSYARAHVLEPENPGPLMELGHFFYSVMDDELTAQMYFRRALELGGGEKCKRMLHDIAARETHLD
ncbi:MAG: hypothetical protein QNJ19_15510 [Woeseiaceae bacterium]|nr:hypothetical protein [Woeseiaceae bacterium]